MPERALALSVIIPAWNAEDFVADAIASALAQDGVTFEVVVVDDASADRTGEKAAAAGDPRVRYHRLPRNRGPGAARNAGLRLAQGRWIALLDADDALAPGRLERLLRLAEGQRADIAIDNLSLVGEEGGAGPMFPARAFAGADGLDLAAFIDDNLPLRTRYNLGYLKPIFRRAFLEAHGIRYDENLRTGEDFIFLADCLAAGARVVRDGEAGYLYTLRDGSTSHRLGLERIDAMIAADAAFARRWSLTAGERSALDRRRRALMRVRAFTAAVEAIKSRDWAGACRALAREPRALVHFRRPLADRLGRLIGHRTAWGAWR